MKTAITFFTTTLILLTTTAFAQTTFKEFKAGHVFYVSLPDYMSKTYGLNSASTIQFKNTVKDVYGFIIEDNKEELKLAEVNYSSLTEFYEDFIKDFLKDEDKRKVSKPLSKNIGEINFMECDVSYNDKDAKADIYYFVGIVETPASYYKVLCWSTLENKDKFKADFQKIFYSIKD
jgi:hypothetical protein